MAEVILYVYDMTKSGSGNDVHNFSVVQANNLLKDCGVNFGGIFHTAVQIYGNDEWAYGHRDKGTGVFTCPAGKNPSYTLREKIVLGRTECSSSKVNKILKDLSESWPGNNYNVVSKNSKHFSNELLERLGVPKLPGWVNRVANIADAAKGAAGTVLKAKDEALKRVFNPFGRSSTSSSKTSKSVKATPIEFNINFNFITESFKVSAPVIQNDDDHHDVGHNQPVIQAIEAAPDPITIVEEETNKDITIVEEEINKAVPIVEEPEDEEPPAVIHTDDKPAAVTMHA